MAVATEAEEAKLPDGDGVVGTKESSLQLTALSVAVKKTAPILAASNVALWTESGAVKVEVTHRESMRTFSAHLRAEDLEKCGFHPRDTAEDCVEIMSDALGAEDIDTVAVTPMASPLEGSDTDTACVKVPFSDCEFLRVSFSIKMRTKLYEYSFVASEQKLDAATRTQLQLQSLKRKIEAQSQQMETMKIKMEEKMEAMEERMTERMETTVREFATLKTKGIASFRSNAMVGRFLKWSEVELVPTLDAMVVLSEDQSVFRIRMEGVYRVLSAVSMHGDMGRAYAQLYINGSGKCYSYGGEALSPVLCFVGRLRVDDTVKVRISSHEHSNAYFNWLNIEKL